MANWVFWTLIVVVLGLVIVIITRDKVIREKILGVFALVKKKIRIARLKAQLNKENENLDDLLAKLGEEAWQKGVNNPGISADIEKLTALDNEHTKLDQEVQRLNKQIEDEKSSWDAFHKKQEQLIKEREEKVEPLDKELAAMKKEQSELAKGIGEQKKIQEKLEKKISSREKKKEEVQKDEDLSNIEKEEKIKELDGELTDFRKQVQQAVEAEASIQATGPDLENKISDLQPRVDGFHNEIAGLKEEAATREKAKDQGIEDSRKNRNVLIGDMTLKKKEMAKLFKTMGVKLQANRVDDSSLLPLYSQIDQKRKVITDLEKQIGRKDTAQRPNS